MKRCNKCQTNQGKVLVDYCHVTSTLRVFCSKNYIITNILSVLVKVLAKGKRSIFNTMLSVLVKIISG